MLYVDVPVDAEIALLARHRDDICVSLYLPTTPLTQDTGGDRIALKNLSAEAVRQLSAAGADKRRVGALAEHLDDLGADETFWRFQAYGLAILATPDHVRTFRMASRPALQVEVSDRFHLKPLLRAVTFPHVAYVLALSENAVRLVEVAADLPAATVKVEGMPTDAASAAGKSSLADRSPSGRIQGSEGKKVRLTQYARKVDQAVRGLLAGSGVPIVLAATQPLASLYRTVNSSPDLAETGIEGNPETTSDAELARSARGVLDHLYGAQLAAWRETFAAREPQGRVTTDVAQAARAATFGAIDSMLVDIDRTLPGAVDDVTGAVVFAEAASARSYGVLDEIARRTLLARGRVLAVRAADIPEGKPLAAILRYAV
jgi:hypothetical protein